MDSTALDTLPLSVLQSQLTEAQHAHHQLMMGKQVATIVKHDGSRVEYNATTHKALSAYIGALTAAITRKQSGNAARRGPIYLGV